MDGDANEYPLKIESKNDLNYQENQEGFHTDQEDQTNSTIKQSQIGALRRSTHQIPHVPEIIAPQTVQEYIHQELPN